mmetsp:Transcript_46389/g.88564  ORF Transcript_46389/g.88564 Transcript_46389/m.88564 type:complete len:245 (+) Transcript_46389:534-1268(+)
MGQHHHLAAALERVLQHHRELAVAVRHVPLLLLQGHDDVPEGGQRPVDVLRLLEPVALGFGLGHALAPRQVDEVHAAVRGEGHGVPGARLGSCGEEDAHQRVRAGASFVHLGGKGGARFLRRAHHTQNVLGSRNAHLQRIWHARSPSLIEMHFQLGVVTRQVLVQEILNLLIVNLYGLHRYRIIDIFRPFCLRLEQILQRAIHQSPLLPAILRPRHGVSLPRAGLSVGEDAQVEPVAHGAQQRL